MIRNDEALADPTYNPTYDEKTKELFSLMSDNDETLLSEYKQIILNYPTKNPYGGVLNNPRGCEIDQVSTMIQDIESKLDQRYETIIRNGTPINDGVGMTYNPTPEQIEEAEEWKTYYPGIKNDLVTSTSTMKDYRSHTDRLIANLPSFIGMIQNYIGITTAIAGLLNPCLPFADFIGSLLDAGRQLIDQVIGALQAVLNVINAALNLIRQAMALVMAVIAAIVSMILNEINKLAQALLALVRMGLAQLLSFLPKDPCIRALLGAVVTGSAMAVLNKD